MLDNWVSDDGNKENNKENNKDNNQEENKLQDAAMHSVARGRDITLLKALNVGTIIDFMVEMKKTKFGVRYVLGFVADVKTTTISHLC